MRIISKSIQLATNLLPRTHSRKSMHFAFGFERNKLLAIGQNHYECSSGVLKLARRFNERHRIKIPTRHAEIDLLRKLWGNHYIDGRTKVVVIRLDKNGNLLNSKPCKSCRHILDAIGITKIWYSCEGGMIRRLL